MKKYVLKRVLTAIFTLLVILLVLFILMQLMPGSPFNDEKLTADQKAMLYAKYGLDQPIIVQFFRYVVNMLRGDFGVSYNISKNTPISQDPMASLNPRKTVGNIIGEGLDIHHMYKSSAEREDKIKRILKKVGLTPEHYGRYPHQFSGGQRQRVGIARALIMDPKLIIADECISALDVSIQAQVVNLMKDIQQETHSAYLFIAHDLSMVKYISDRIGVLHLGHMLETGTTEEIFARPMHPYTRSLLSAIPSPNPVLEKKRTALNYDYKTSGIDYDQGTDHLVEGSHYVCCTDEEFARWMKETA